MSTALIGTRRSRTKTLTRCTVYGAYGQPDSWAGNPIRFTGRWAEHEVGLYYYRARFYSPSLGRFLQTDPIGYGDNMNMYAYVGNDPMNATDPSGMCTGSRITNSDGSCRAGGGDTINSPADTRLANKTLSSRQPSHGTQTEGSTTTSDAGPSNGVQQAQALPVPIPIPVPGVTPNSSSDTPTYQPEMDFLNWLASLFERRQYSHVVRVQVQGDGRFVGQHSRTIERNRPVRAAEVHVALDQVRSELSRRQLRSIDFAIDRAHSWVDRVAQAGGVGPESGFSERASDMGGSQGRVDIEIWSGRNIVP